MEIINEKNFSEKTKNGVVVVDFFANWCGPCRMMAPILENIQEELGGKISIYKVDVDESEELSRKFGVMSIPTLVIFKNGEEQNKLIGLRPKDSLLTEFNSYIDD